MAIYGLPGGLPSLLPLALAAAAPSLPISDILALLKTLPRLMPPIRANSVTVIVLVCFMLSEMGWRYFDQRVRCVVFA